MLLRRSLSTLPRCRSSITTLQAFATTTLPLSSTNNSIIASSKAMSTQPSSATSRAPAYSTLSNLHLDLNSSTLQVLVPPYPAATTVHQRHVTPADANTSPIPPPESVISPTSKAATKTYRGYSSVLVGLFEHPATKALHVLLTQRTQDLRSHAGDVALPGGKKDPTDVNDVDCALRESNEEIGLPRCKSDYELPSPVDASVRIMSQARYAISSNGLLVTPVIAQIPVPQFLLDNMNDPPTISAGHAFDPVLNPSEVSYLFSVPLSLFIEGGKNYAGSGSSAAATAASKIHPSTASADATIHSFRDILWKGSPVRVHEFSIELPDTEFISTPQAKLAEPQLSTTKTFRIWGLTAYVLIGVAMQLFRMQPRFGILAKAIPNTTGSATSNNTSSSSATQTMTSKL